MNCKTQIQPPKKALEMAGIPENSGKLYWQGAGCDQCFHSGYRGRIGVFEVMLIQEELRRCILEGADRTRFLEAAFHLYRIDKADKFFIFTDRHLERRDLTAKLFLQF